MAEIRTSESLLDALKKAASTSPSSEQIEKQRISFIMGVLPTGNNMTRADVEKILENQRGLKAAVG